MIAGLELGLAAGDRRARPRHLVSRRSIALGWRAIATVVGTTLTILVFVTGGLLLLRLV